MKRKTYLSGITAIVFLLVCGLLLFTGCSNSSGGGGGGGSSGVVSVTIIQNGQPVTQGINAAKGARLNFDVDVVVNGGASEAVTWSVTGGVAGTSIANGVLIIATNEADNAQLKVKAASTAKPAIFAEVTVTVLSPTAPVVNSITVTSAANSVERGTTLQFTMNVSVDNGAAQTVNWSIDEAGRAGGTSVNATGLLTVAATETLTTLTVRATSTVQGFTNVSGTKAVSVTAGSGPTPERFEGLIFSNGDMGTEFQVDGSVVTAATIGAIEGGLNGHTQAVILTVLGEYGSGIGFPLTGTGFALYLDMSEFTALSFWAKSPTGITIPSVTFGTDSFEVNAYAVTYAGEDGNGIVVGNTWQEIVVPIPASKSVTIDGRAFTMWIGNAEANKILYLDDIKFIKDSRALTSIAISPDGIMVPPSASYPVRNILNNMKLVYTIGSKTTTLFNKNIVIDNWFNPITFTVTGSAGSTGNTMTGANITNAARGQTFNMTVGIGAVTSNSAIYQIAAKNIVEIDSFTSGATHVAGNQGDEVGEWNGGRWGWGQMDANGYFGGGNIDDVRLTEQVGVPCFSFSTNSGDYNGAVGGRVITTTWDLSGLDYITFKYYTTAAGNRAVFGVRSGTVGRDEAVWPSTYTVNFTTLNAWTEVKITKAQLGGTVNWSAVNGWRFFVAGLGFPNHGGGAVFISDMKAEEN